MQSAFRSRGPFDCNQMIWNNMAFKFKLKFVKGIINGGFSKTVLLWSTNGRLPSNSLTDRLKDGQASSLNAPIKLISVQRRGNRGVEGWPRKCDQ